MFERYDEQARRVLFFSRYEASQLGGQVIEPENLLLGLLREPGGIIDRILTGAGTTAEAVRAELLRGWPQREKVSSSVEIPFAAPTKRILGFAAAEADALNHDHIGPEHLLLGILREETCDAARTLAAHGVRLDNARRISAERVPEKRDANPQRAAVFDRIERIRIALVHLGIAQSDDKGSPEERSFAIRRIETALDELTRLLRDLL